MVIVERQYTPYDCIHGVVIVERQYTPYDCMHGVVIVERSDCRASKQKVTLTARLRERGSVIPCRDAYPVVFVRACTVASRGVTDARLHLFRRTGVGCNRRNRRRHFARHCRSMSDRSNLLRVQATTTGGTPSEGTSASTWARRTCSRLWGAWCCPGLSSRATRRSVVVTLAQPAVLFLRRVHALFLGGGSRGRFDFEVPRSVDLGGVV